MSAKKGSHVTGELELGDHGRLGGDVSEQDIKPDATDVAPPTLPSGRRARSVNEQFAVDVPKRQRFGRHGDHILAPSMSPKSGTGIDGSNLVEGRETEYHVLGCFEVVGHLVHRSRGVEGMVGLVVLPEALDARGELLGELFG